MHTSHRPGPVEIEAARTVVDETNLPLAVEAKAPPPGPPPVELPSSEPRDPSSPSPVREPRERSLKGHRKLEYRYDDEIYIINNIPSMCFRMADAQKQVENEREEEGKRWQDFVTNNF